MASRTVLRKKNVGARRASRRDSPGHWRDGTQVTSLPVHPRDRSRLGRNRRGGIARRAPGERGGVVRGSGSDRRRVRIGCRNRDRRVGRRLLLGSAGSVPTRQRRDAGRVRLCRRCRGHRSLRDRRHRLDWPRRVGTHHLRPGQGDVRPTSADLLLGRDRPDPTRPSGSRHGHPVQVGDLRAERRPTAHRAAYIAQLSQAAVFAAPIVTKVEPNTGFFPAEAYHQNYLDLHPTSAYIVMNDKPKVDDLARLFPQRYRDQPVLVSVA